MTDDQKRTTVARLNGRTQIEAFEAAKAIWEDPDEDLERPLIFTLKNGRRPFNRAAAAFGMQILKTPKIVRALEQVVGNKSENGRVRGEAAEALAHGHRNRSHNVLLSGLRDPNKDVRFWCAFVLGEMAEQRAVGVLRRLAASDKRVVRGFHSVATEAADALENILNGKKQHARKSGCVFCARG